jgi:hypothetical protein
MAAFSAFRLSCGAQLVVNEGDVELDAGRVARAAEFLGEELVALHLAHAHRAQQAGQRVDADHLDGLALLGKCGACDQQDGGSGNGFDGKFHWCLHG